MKKYLIVIGVVIIILGGLGYFLFLKTKQPPNISESEIEIKVRNTIENILSNPSKESQQLRPFQNIGLVTPKDFLKSGIKNIFETDYTLIPEGTRLISVKVQDNNKITLNFSKEILSDGSRGLDIPYFLTPAIAKIIQPDEEKLEEQQGIAIQHNLVFQNITVLIEGKLVERFKQDFLDNNFLNNFRDISTQNWKIFNSVKDGGYPLSQLFIAKYPPNWQLTDPHRAGSKEGYEDQERRCFVSAEGIDYQDTYLDAQNETQKKTECFEIIKAIRKSLIFDSKNTILPTRGD